MSKKILLVDDDNLNITLIKFGLKDAQYDVIVAEDGQIGLEKVQQERPDLIVLDVQMPRMSGLEFMGELKALADNGLRDIPVVMLTANETMQDVFFMEGVKGYFVKPVHMGNLKAKIAELLV